MRSRAFVTRTRLCAWVGPEAMEDRRWLARAQGSPVAERTPECRAALGLLRGGGAACAVEACGGALFDNGDNLEVSPRSQPDLAPVPCHVPDQAPSCDDFCSLSCT